MKTYDLEFLHTILLNISTLFHFKTYKNDKSLLKPITVKPGHSNYLCVM